MKELNSVTQGASTGAIARLPRPVSFPQGRLCTRLRVEATVGVKNTTGGPLDYTGARAKKAIECLFKTTALRFGDRRPDQVDVALDFARARETAIAMTGDDFLVMGEGGYMKRLRDVADADVVFAAVAAGATKSLVLEYVRPFEVARLGKRAFSYCPGASQMEQIQWEAVRGGDATFDTNGNFAQDGAANFQFVADDAEASDDKWAPIVRLYQQEEAGLVSHGPSGRIGLLALWLYNGAGASTPLTLFSVTRIGDAPLHDNVRAARVVRDALYTDPAGVYDLNALATVLVNLPADADPEDVPVGEGFMLSQTANELAPIKSAWLYVPVRAEGDVDQLVGANLEDEAGVKLINAAAKSPAALPATAAALEAVIIARRGAPDFAALPGRVYARGLAPTTHVPGSVMAAAQAAVSGSGDAEARDAAATKMATQIAKAAPGWLPGKRNARSNQVAAMRNRLRG